MKILIISSYYPPYFVGGYELRANQMSHALRERNHDVFVLTSKHGLGHRSVDDGVYRVLDARPDVILSAKDLWHVFRMSKIELINHFTLKRVLKRVKPNIILVMHIHSLLKSLLMGIEHTKVPVVYDISDPAMLFSTNSGDKWNKWFDWWTKESSVQIKKIGKYILQKLISVVVPTSREPISLNNSYFTSEAIKQAYIDSGFQIEDSPVFAPGICLPDFPFARKNLKKDTIELLYTGRIASEKGLETAVEALSLIKKKADQKIRLTLAGPCVDATYIAKLEDIVQLLSLENEVSFLPPQPLKQMPALYQSHDVFVFPAVWEEPFGRAWIEALASGLPLITTATGGARDYLRDKENCLIFPPKDKEALANSILRVMQDPQLLNMITKNGRQLVEKKFSFTDFIDRVETYLEQSINAFTSPQSHQGTKK